MAFNLKEFKRWLDQQIQACEVPSGMGVAYDESVKPLVKETLEMVDEKVKQMEQPIFSDLEVGQFFRWKGDISITYLKRSDNEAVCITGEGTFPPGARQVADGRSCVVPLVATFEEKK